MEHMNGIYSVKASYLTQFEWGFHLPKGYNGHGDIPSSRLVN